MMKKRMAMRMFMLKVGSDVKGAHVLTPSVGLMVGVEAWWGGSVLCVRRSACPSLTFA